MKLIELAILGGLGYGAYRLVKSQNEPPKPPETPPPPPGVQGIQSVGARAVSPESAWTWSALQLYRWSNGRWELLLSDIAPYPPGNLGTTGTVHNDVYELAHIYASDYWVAAVRWVWVNPPLPNAGWQLWDSEVERPRSTD